MNKREEASKKNNKKKRMYKTHNKMRIIEIFMQRVDFVQELSE